MKKLLAPPYKGDSGAWYTQQLFYEPWSLLDPPRKVCEPIFSLHSDRPGMINARVTFVALMDPTGYKWAMKYLGSYQHWQRLCKCTFFAEALEEWQAELRIKQTSEAIDRIRAIAEDGSAQAINANKYLAEEAWLKPKAGRPSKEALTGELKRQARVVAETTEDAARIGLKAV